MSTAAIANPILSPSPEHPWVVGIANKLEWKNAVWNESNTIPPYMNGSPFNVSFGSLDGKYQNGSQCNPCNGLNGVFIPSSGGSIYDLSGTSGSVGVELSNLTAGDYNIGFSYTALGSDGQFHEILFTGPGQNFTVLTSYDDAPKVVEVENSDDETEDSGPGSKIPKLILGGLTIVSLLTVIL